eukprot:Rmarinus@m.24116
MKLTAETSRRLFLQQAGESEVEVLLKRSFSVHEDEYDEVIEELMVTKVSVVVVLSHASYVQQLLIEAAEGGVGERSFLWVGVDGWAKARVFETDDIAEQATLAEMLANSVGIGFYVDYNGAPYRLANNVWSASEPGHDFDAIDTSEDIPYYGAYTIDAVLTVAHAVKELLSNKEEIQSKSLVDAIRSVNFNGLSGPITFDENGDRIGSYSIFYVAPGTSSYSLVGRSYPNGTLEYDIPWAGGKVPVALPCPDGTYYDKDDVACVDGVEVPKEVYVAIVMPLFLAGEPVDSFVEAYSVMVGIFELLNLLQMLSSSLLEIDGSPLESQLALVLGEEEMKILLRTTLKPVVFDTHGDANTCEDIASEVAAFRSEDGYKISVVVGLVYAQCVETFYPIVRAADIPMVSFGASSPLFSSAKYSYLFRTIPSDLLRATSLSSFSHEIDFRRVAALYNTRDDYTEAMARAFLLEPLLTGNTDRETNVRLKHQIDDRDDDELIRPKLKDIKDGGFHIIYLSVLSEQLKTIFSVAEDLKMIQEEYTYLINTNGDIGANPPVADISLLKGSFTAAFHAAEPAKILNGVVKVLTSYNMINGCYGPQEEGACASCKTGTDGQGHLLWEWDHDANSSTPGYCIAYQEEWMTDPELPFRYPSSGYAVDAALTAIIGIATTLVTSNGGLLGADVAESIGDVEFDGLTGYISFNEATGDRQNGEYDILNFDGDSCPVVAGTWDFRTACNDDTCATEGEGGDEDVVSRGVIGVDSVSTCPSASEIGVVCNVEDEDATDDVGDANGGSDGGGGGSGGPIISNTDIDDWASDFPFGDNWSSVFDGFDSWESILGDDNNWDSIFDDSITWNSMFSDNWESLLDGSDWSSILDDLLDDSRFDDINLSDFESFLNDDDFLNSEDEHWDDWIDLFRAGEIVSEVAASGINPRDGTGDSVNHTAYDSADDSADDSATLGDGTPGLGKDSGTGSTSGGSSVGENGADSITKGGIQFPAGAQSALTNGNIDDITSNGGIDEVTSNGGIDDVTSNSGIDDVTLNDNIDDVATESTLPPSELLPTSKDEQNDLSCIVYSTEKNTKPRYGCVETDHYLNEETYRCQKCSKNMLANDHELTFCTWCGKESCSIILDNPGIPPAAIALVLSLVCVKVYLMRRTAVNAFVNSFLLKEAVFTTFSACGDLGDIATDIYSYVLVLSTSELSDYWRWYTLVMTIATATSLHAFFIRSRGLWNVWITNTRVVDHGLLGCELWMAKLRRARLISYGSVFTALWEDLPHLTLYVVMTVNVLRHVSDEDTKRAVATSMALSLCMFGYRLSNLDKIILVGPMEQVLGHVMEEAKEFASAETSEGMLSEVSSSRGDNGVSETFGPRKACDWSSGKSARVLTLNGVFSPYADLSAIGDDDGQNGCYTGTQETHVSCNEKCTDKYGRVTNGSVFRTGVSNGSRYLLGNSDANGDCTRGFEFKSNPSARWSDNDNCNGNSQSNGVNGNSLVHESGNGASYSHVHRIVRGNRCKDGTADAGDNYSNYRKSPTGHVAAGHEHTVSVVSEFTVLSSTSMSSPLRNAAVRSPARFHVDPEDDDCGDHQANTRVPTIGNGTRCHDGNGEAVGVRSSGSSAEDTTKWGLASMPVLSPLNYESSDDGETDAPHSGGNELVIHRNNTVYDDTASAAQKCRLSTRGVCDCESAPGHKGCDCCSESARALHRDRVGSVVTPRTNSVAMLPDSESARALH